MKRITVYVNTRRVHWLVEELQSIGVTELMVTEYFGPSSQISRFEFLCEDHAVDAAKNLVYRVGTRGDPSDHFVDIKDVDPDSVDHLSLGQRISRLQTGE